MKGTIHILLKNFFVTFLCFNAYIFLRIAKFKTLFLSSYRVRNNQNFRNTAFLLVEIIILIELYELTWWEDFKLGTSSL
jgi:hypothetical protein